MLLILLMELSYLNAPVHWGEEFSLKSLALTRDNSKRQTHLRWKKSFATGKWVLSEVVSLSGWLKALCRRRVTWCRCSVAVQVAVAFGKSFWQLLPWEQWGSVSWHFCKVSTDEARARLLEKAVGRLAKTWGAWLVLLSGSRRAVFWRHRGWPSLFCGCGPSPGRPKARSLSFPDDHEQKELSFSHTYQGRLYSLLEGLHFSLEKWQLLTDEGWESSVLAVT